MKFIKENTTITRVLFVLVPQIKFILQTVIRKKTAGLKTTNMDSGTRHWTPMGVAVISVSYARLLHLWVLKKLNFWLGLRWS